jgi:hypothetical protein
MGDAPPSHGQRASSVRPTALGRGKIGRRAAVSERPSVPDICILSKGVLRSGQDSRVDTASGTGQKSCGLHCWQITDDKSCINAA